MSNSSPDILFIVLDTLRRDRVSSYGSPQPTTPELDAFSENATIFNRAVAP
ncbi:MAG: sulfatase-like hydrolase/transferase, partial [Anaerolineae bacterium]|nr:sulfatase-like hydrolase/transferase [Anaerolineae bacterium]